MATSSVPEFDEELRLRLGRRFGGAIDAWFDALPAVLNEVAERWDIEWGTLIQRGSMSVVIRCRAADGRPAVLKVSPDRKRVAQEATALASWSTAHVPAVLAVDESVGALLIEAVEPGTPLAESSGYPSETSLAALLTALHGHGVPDPLYRPVAEHIACLFDSGMKNYERRPDLAELIPPELYTRGRRLAMRLAADAAPTVLLHGDLTPVNVLDGGADRGLVAIDPAPCLGDPAFDAIDLVFWRAGDVDTIAVRAEQFAPVIGADTRRLLDWCTAFAGMVALEIAEAPAGSREQVEPLVALASRA
ncbi:MAG TPA: aminoglycoside phosphotransferase family protein [Gaiellaceae bacterium]|nr:aminoglycoside phosphotransferase family protein [Gaiellaceae bacterium]